MGEWGIKSTGVALPFSIFHSQFGIAERPAPWDAGLCVSRLYYASAGASTVTLCSCISFSAIRSSIVSLVRISSSTVMVS